jgi:hypothetical protein
MKTTVRPRLLGLGPAGALLLVGITLAMAAAALAQKNPDRDCFFGRCLPERGRIGIFDHPYYEEVLALEADGQGAAL